MLSKLLKSAAAMILVLMMGIGSTHASARIQVKIGERVDLMGASANTGATYKWVVKKGDSIVNTQVLRNFSYTFAEQGQFAINLTATDASRVETTTVDVMVGDVYVPASGGTTTTGTPTTTGPRPLKLNLSTLPALSDANQVKLLGDSGRVTYFLSQSTGEIVEYRIDRNIFVDSDGNGIANDDIDNDTSSSYLTGQPWTTEYRQTESAQIAAEVTLVDKGGKKEKGQAQILFEPLDQSGTLLAVLESTPGPDPKDNAIHLTGDPSTVAFYARRSKGKILEYRIDKDIFTDSDGDGDPANDIDNLKDPSFKTGDVWETSYAKTDKQVIAQLIAVGEGGKGSRVQRGIVFSEAPSTSGTGAVAGGIQLTADKEFVVKGDPITFTVEGLQLDKDQYTFDWDFQGLGQVDQQVEGSTSVQTIYDVPGVYTVKVKITDRQNRTLDRTLELVVKDAVTTQADFSMAIDGNTVTFKNLSTVAMNLTDKRLLHQWSFGDTDPANFESQKAKVGESDPVYTYSKKGNYIATLTITDADKVTDSKSTEFTIEQDAPASGTTETPAGGTETGTETTTPAASGSLLMRILKVLLYLILIVVVLIILIVGGFLAFLKAKHPELTFDELVDEAKNTVLGKIGVHDFEDHVDASDQLPKMPTSGPVHHEEPAPAPAAEEPAPQPSWAKGKDIIEGEVDETKADDTDKTPPPPVNEQGPTPDWLKNVK